MSLFILFLIVVLLSIALGLVAAGTFLGFAEGYLFIGFTGILVFVGLFSADIYFIFQAIVATIAVIAHTVKAA